ncbi:hypothetical protein CEXT_90311 [Caerostris extrusa]|uniref:Uncharacterized protein n=1 Tax=Caerostris extrusa TaxID=172846 RepID=A0AAV4NT09_CAEEX|nr:hypothetical protein CEXT_90311 [Caerostris extrusa]
MSTFRLHSLSYEAQKDCHFTNERRQLQKTTRAMYSIQANFQTSKTTMLILALFVPLTHISEWLGSPVTPYHKNSYKTLPTISFIRL